MHLSRRILRFLWAVDLVEVFAILGFSIICHVISFSLFLSPTGWGLEKVVWFLITYNIEDTNVEQYASLPKNLEHQRWLCEEKISLSSSAFKSCVQFWQADKPLGVRCFVHCILRFCSLAAQNVAVNLPPTLVLWLTLKLSRSRLVSFMCKAR